METRGAKMKKNSKKRLGGGFGGGRAILALAAFSAFAAPALYASTAMASCSISGTLALNTGGVLESCSVTQGGVYDVTEYGGAGGGDTNDSGVVYNGSAGAEISAQFSMTAGQTFEVVTGAAGTSGYKTTVAASGGGGTFLVLASGGTLTPYLVAGGAGGDSYAPGVIYYGRGGQEVAGNPALENGDGGDSPMGIGGAGYLSGSSNNGSSGFINQAIGSTTAGNGGGGHNYGTTPQDMIGGGGGGYGGGEGGFPDAVSGYAGFGGVNYYNPSLATDVTQAGGSSDVATPAVGQIDFTLVSASGAPTSGTTGSGTPVPEPPAFTIFLLAVSGLFLASRLRRSAARAAGEA